MASQESPAKGRAGQARPPQLAGGLDEWKALLGAEEQRCAELGIGAAVVSIGLRAPEAAPDDEAVTRTIAGHLAATDRVCVLRRGEYGVLMAPVAGRVDAERRTTELYQKLRRDGLDVSMGWAMRRDGHGLFNAAAQADAAMLRSSAGRLDLTERD